MKTSRLVMGVSKLNIKPEEAPSEERSCNVPITKYEWQGKIQYAGYSQLEPIVQLMCEKMYDEKMQEFECVFLCTQKVVEIDGKIIHSSKDNDQKKQENISGLTDRSKISLEETDTESYTTVEYLIHRIGYYITGNADYFKNQQFGRNLFSTKEPWLVYKDNQSKIRFVLIAVDENAANDNSRENGLNNVLDYIKKMHKAEDSLWLDTHGGFREISMLLASLVSLLRVENIVPEKVLGVLHDDVSKISRIVEQKQMLNINLFVAGMEEFVNYGSIRTLKKYYHELWESYPEKNTELEKAKGQTEKWMDEMEKISNGIQLCDSKLFQEGTDGLKKLLETESLQKQSEEAVNQENFGLDAYFSVFVDYIKKDYGVLLEKYSVLQLIKRCFEKGMYQQTLTFIEAEMPVYLNLKGVVVLHGRPKDNNADKKYSKMNVTELFNECIKGINTDKDKHGYLFNEMKVIKSVSDAYSDTGLTDKHASINWENMHIKDNMINDNIYENYKIHCNGVKVDKNKKSENEKDMICLLYLHKALKRCRNQYNHASKEKRVELKDVQNTITAYLLLTQKLVKAAGKEI